MSHSACNYGFIIFSKDYTVIIPLQRIFYDHISCLCHTQASLKSCFPSIIKRNTISFEFKQLLCSCFNFFLFFSTVILEVKLNIFGALLFMYYDTQLFRPSTVTSNQDLQFQLKYLQKLWVFKITLCVSVVTTILYANRKISTQTGAILTHFTGYKNSDPACNLD